MSTFVYDAATRTATITSVNGRHLTLSNVSQERAEKFYARYRAEKAAREQRGDRSDPMAFTTTPGG
jgi:hypothetical protein